MPSERITCVRCKGGGDVPRYDGNINTKRIFIRKVQGATEAGNSLEVERLLDADGSSPHYKPPGERRRPFLAKQDQTVEKPDVEAAIAVVEEEIRELEADRVPCSHCGGTGYLIKRTLPWEVVDGLARDPSRGGEPVERDYVERVEVPGGWLVRSVLQGNHSNMVLVHDPDHSWRP